MTQKYFSIFRLLSILGLGGLFGCAHLSDQSPNLVLETQPEPEHFQPTLTLQSVYGTFSDVTEVTVRSEGGAAELPLHSVGNHIWQAKLTALGLHEFASDQKGGHKLVLIKVCSKNMKSRSECYERQAEINGNPGFHGVDRLYGKLGG